MSEKKKSLESENSKIEEQEIILTEVKPAEADASAGSFDAKKDGGEKHHHHHHHHHSSEHHSGDHHSSGHHSSGHHSSGHHKSSKKKSSKINLKSRKTLILGAIALLVIIIIVGTVAVAKRNSVKVDESNRFSFNIVEQDVFFSGNKIANIYVRFGNYNDTITREFADYSFTPSESFHAMYNGPYTATVEYRDGQTENHYFEISGIAQPIELSEENGMIKISVNKNYRVNFLYYIYGQSLGDPYARYMSLDADTTEVPALGNGVHTFRVNATTNIGEAGTSSYYVGIDVKSCTQPLVLAKDDFVGLYAYGFNITSVSYAKGVYSSWDEMRSIDGLYYTSCNTSLPRSDFEPGVYTFCFKTSSRDYIIQQEL